MQYQKLSTQTIELGSRAVLDWNAGNGVVFVPQNDAKIFLHWLYDNGNVRSTYTMTSPTRVEGNLRLTNALDTEAIIQVIHLD